MARAFIFGISITIAVAIACAYIAVTAGLVPANADAQPSKLEAWAARKSLRATITREAPKEANPVALTDENLVAGIKLYAQDCAVCHGDKSAKSTDIAHGLYQKPPQLAKEGVEDDPEGVTFWKVKHGIRLTGMPAYAADLSDKQIWQVALFLKHMDKLPPKADREWKNVHVKGKDRAGDRE